MIECLTAMVISSFICVYFLDCYTQSLKNQAKLMRQTMSFRRIIEHKNKIETAKETINLVEENSILIIEADNWEKLRKLSVKGDENFSLEIKD